jgi:hypothetical protein
MSAQTHFPTLLAQALQQVLGTATAGADLPAITLPAAATPTAPALLAQAASQAPTGGAAIRGAPGQPLPLEANAALYARCLALYRERVQPGHGADDLGRAAALFVMANLAALGRDGGDTATLQALTQQMQNALQRLPTWPSTSLAEQQQTFEQLAILGVLVTQSWEAARGPGTLAAMTRAKVKAAALSYLQQWLGLDPALLRLSPQGLTVAAPAVAHLAKSAQNAQKAPGAHKALTA